MTHYPRPVVMLSSLTKEGAVETIQALTLGAVDFIAKPDLKANMGSILQEVVSKIIRASKAKVTALSRRVPVETKITANKDGKKKQIRPMLNNDRLVIIGSSTGGPRALNTVIHCCRQIYRQLYDHSTHPAGLRVQLPSGDINRNGCKGSRTRYP
jgi:two-component system chemotaxis response regulator CheB